MMDTGSLSAASRAGVGGLHRQTPFCAPRCVNPSDGKRQMNKQSRIPAADLLDDGLELIQKLEATLHQWGLLHRAGRGAAPVSRADVEAVEWMHQCLSDLSATIDGMQHQASRTDGYRKAVHGSVSELAVASQRPRELQHRA
ncbi:hypothetical protein [Arthrobacter sp. NPDC092385]|uniref:hypothetical protein n=1 Tax=Arthrobacter sp. NPDC092385 TaxID=3363943 RepID=UPI00382BD8F0